MESHDYVKKFSETVRGRVAVFIDAANLEKSAKSMFVHPRDIPKDKAGIQIE